MILQNWLKNKARAQQFLFGSLEITTKSWKDFFLKYIICIPLTDLIMLVIQKSYIPLELEDHEEHFKLSFFNFRSEIKLQLSKKPGKIFFLK